jgi:hypothetical protein
MYRLLFASDFWHVLGSRSYVSGLLIDTRVVALLGLRTRRDLITGKVSDDHLGRQTPPLGHVNMPCRSVGGVTFPFHACDLSRTPLDCFRVLDTDSNLISWRIKRRFVSQNTPCHACQLVCQRDC